MAERLTKEDTVALWYAVDAYHLQVQHMRTMEFTDEQIAAERARVRAAKSALRKVNRMRKEASHAGA